MFLHKKLVLHILIRLGRFFAAFGITVVLAVLIGRNLKIRDYVLPL
jgi:hypothetical protein